MGTVIDFEARAVASLRRRVAEVEEVNQDLLAFARGHSGAVAAIHEAVLAAADAEGLDHLIHIITQHWPQILGLDAVSLALFVWLLTLHPAAAGRVYAAYGGVYITVALAWLWGVDGVRPSVWDFAVRRRCSRR